MDKAQQNFDELTIPKILEDFYKIYLKMDGIYQGIVLSKLFIDLKDKKKFYGFIEYMRKEQAQSTPAKEE